jgi:hypothetical protein
VNEKKKQDLKQMEREQKKPRKCDRHPRAVFYDEPECPACKAEKEFLEFDSK